MRWKRNSTFRKMVQLVSSRRYRRSLFIAVTVCFTCIACKSIFNVIPSPSAIPPVVDQGELNSPQTVATHKCPLMLDNKGVEYQKNWYVTNRTAEQVMHGLQESAAMLKTVQDLSGAQMVVMYGSLIGQWWNGQSLPWDADIDVHVLDYLSFERWLTNQSRMQSDKYEKVHGQDVGKVHYYELPNANFTIYFDHNEKHHIEYRLIHIPTGVYCDMMTSRLTSDMQVLSHRVTSKPPVLRVPAYAMKASFKNIWGGNIHNTVDMIPLSPCPFNGVSLWCPRNVTNVLRQQFPHFDDVAWYQNEKKAMFNKTTSCWQDSKR